MTQPPHGPDQPQQPEQPDQGQTPQDPYGAPPPPPPSYGYGSPSSPPPPEYGAPPAGAPGNPYAAPSGYPAHHFTGEQPPAGKGMAIGALVSAFLCCLPVGLVLGIIVLRRSKDGRDHGKGLAIAAIIVNVLTILAAIAFVVFVAVFAKDVRAVPDLERGDCISAEGLRGEGTEEGFKTITIKECTEPHDAEVLATAVLTEDALEADTVDGQYGGLCTDAIAEDPARAEAALRDDVSLLIIYEVEEPGETVACLGLDAGGDQLTEPLVE